MSEDQEKSISTSKIDPTIITGTGFVGAMLTGHLSTYTLDESLKENLLLGIPVLSIFLVQIIIWIYSVLKPENAGTIAYRCSLKKQQKQIEKSLKSTVISATHKQELQKMYDKSSKDLADSYHPDFSVNFQ